MKRIRFTEDALYENEGYQKGTTYKAGSTHDFEDHFADRWLHRGKAVEVNTREPLPADDADDKPADRQPDEAKTAIVGERGADVFDARPPAAPAAVAEKSPEPAKAPPPAPTRDAAKPAAKPAKKS